MQRDIIPLFFFTKFPDYMHPYKLEKYLHRYSRDALMVFESERFTQMHMCVRQAFKKGVSQVLWL